ncbi:MAG: hypothetical protein ACJ0G8_05640 [Dehalococcoidia bacterium]|mgnify:CR=1 FL=1
MFSTKRIILSNLSIFILVILIFFSSSCVESKPRISIDKIPVIESTVIINLPKPTVVIPTPEIIPATTLVPTISDSEKNVPPFPKQPEVELSPTIVVKPTAIIPTISSNLNNQSTNSPPNSYVQEMARLIYEKNIDPSKLYLVDFYPYKWSDASYGCPDPGIYYDDSLGEYPGYKYFLSDSENTWEYHVDINDTLIFRCDEIKLLDGPTINVYKEFNLEKTEKVILLTRNFVNFGFDQIDQVTTDDMDKLLSVLNLDIPISDYQECSTIFRLDFYLDDLVHSIDYLCPNDKNVITGLQPVWESRKANAPLEIGSIIGNYLTGKPIPQLPK